MSCYVVVPPEQEIESVPATGYNPYYFPVEGAYLPFFFTDETFTKVLSALINGAFQTYGDEGMQVIWYFLQNVEFPMPACDFVADALLNCETVQEAIATLIATNPTVQEALRGFVTSDETINQHIQDIATAGTPAPETTLVSTTDDDALFGAITFLVDTMYDAIVDFNGLAEITTNLRERGALLFEAIPVLETAPVDEVAEFIDMIYENVMEVFDAQWSTTPGTGSRDRIRCGLFCLAKLNDGVLTWEMTRDYFWEQVSFVPGGPVVGVIAQFVAFFITGNWVGQAVVDISFANFATAMTVGQQFGDLFFPSMNTLMQLGLNNPDPDWETLCEDCAEPTGWIDNNFAGGDQQDWAPYVSSLTFAAWTGSGWEREDDATQIAIIKPISGEITDIEVYFDAPLSGSGGVMWAGSTGLTGLQVGSTTDEQKFTWTGVAISGGLGLDLYRPGGFASNQQVVRVRYKLA
jgi:hypothetical protein